MNRIAILVYHYILSFISDKYIIQTYSDEITEALNDIYIESTFYELMCRIRLKCKAVKTNKIPDEYVAYFSQYREKACEYCLINFIAHSEQKLVYTKLCMFVDDLASKIGSKIHGGTVVSEIKFNDQLFTRIVRQIALLPKTSNIKPPVKVDIPIKVDVHVAVDCSAEQCHAVFVIISRYLSPTHVFRLRLVCKSFTFDQYNYGKHITLTHYDIADMKYVPQFLKKQKELHGKQIKIRCNDRKNLFEEDFEKIKSIQLIRYVNDLEIADCAIHTLIIHDKLARLNVAHSQINWLILNEDVDTLLIFGALLNNFSFKKVRSLEMGLKLQESMITMMPLLFNDETLASIQELHIYEIEITEFPDQCVDKLKNLKVLEFFGVKLNDISNLNKLNLSKFKADGNSIYDGSAVKNVPDVSLSSTRITNVRVFANVHTLDLSFTRVTDVSMLGRVFKLDLKRTHISNVNGLGVVMCEIPNCSYNTWRKRHSANHILILSGTNISNADELGRVYDLNLHNTKVSVVSSLKKVHSLNLRRCPVTDFSSLTNVYKLNVRDTEFSALPPNNKVRTLLTGGPGLNECSSLKNVVNLQLISNDGVRELSTLQKAQGLIYQSSAFKSIPKLEQIRYLDLAKSTVSDLSALKDCPNLHTLNIEYAKIKEIPDIPSLVVLKGYGSDIRFIPVLESVVYISLSSCKNLTHIANLKYAKNLELLYINDTPVDNIYALKDLHRLIYLMIGGTNVSDISMLHQPFRQLKISGAKINLSKIILERGVTMLRKAMHEFRPEEEVYNKNFLNIESGFNNIYMDIYDPNKEFA